MTLHDRIQSTDFNTATSADIAILLEQVFTQHDSRVRDGGPIIVAQGILKKFEASIRERAAPELHTRVKGRCSELRSTVKQLDTLLSQLEKDNAQGQTRT